MSKIHVTRIGEHVAHVELNRPEKANAMNLKFWTHYRQTFELIAQDTTIRAVVVSGRGKHFTVGLDITDPEQTELLFSGGDDVARNAYSARATILSLQDTFTAMERVSARRWNLLFTL